MQNHVLNDLYAVVQKCPDKVAYSDGEHGLTFAQEELLFDPQTSGGLLLAVEEADAQPLLEELRTLDLPCGDIGTILPRLDAEIIVEP